MTSKENTRNWKFQVIFAILFSGAVMILYSWLKNFDHIDDPYLVGLMIFLPLLLGTIIMIPSLKELYTKIYRLEEEVEKLKNKQH